MEISYGKLASLVVSAVYVIAAAATLGRTAALACAVGCTLPLVLIWFSEELGSFTGGGGRMHSIDLESPEWAVAGLGWAFLIGGPIVGVWLAMR